MAARKKAMRFVLGGCVLVCLALLVSCAGPKRDEDGKAGLAMTY
jgi:hypothetical protein